MREEYQSEVLERVCDSMPTAQRGTTLTTAVQRALADLYLLNLSDDVDGQMGARTRAAWSFFKDGAHRSDPDLIDADSVQALLQAVDHRDAVIGMLKVDLQPDFEFRRNKAQDNRDKSATAIIAAARARQLTNAQIAYVLATAEHESDSFKTLEEYSSGAQYENPVDLGNTTPGDGVRFKGRGYVQLTGRLNYTRYSEIAGLELERYPIIVMNWPALSVFVIVVNSRLASSCLSGCFSRPPDVVYGRAAAAFSFESAPISASVRQRRNLPAVPGRVSLARRARVPALWSGVDQRPGRCYPTGS